MKHDVIVPVFNNGELTRRCLESLLAAGSNDYRVILMDNASTVEEMSLYYPALRKGVDLFVRNTENLGFVKAVNQGLLLAQGHYITLLNNDAYVEPGFFQDMEFSLNLYADKKVGAVGPVTDAPGQAQSRYPQTKMPHVHVLPFGSMLSFFCTMFLADCIDDVGLLDEDFGVGLGDDDEYCGRMQSKGWQLALAQHVMVHHSHRTTFKQLYSDSEIAEMQRKAMDKVNAKAAEREMR